MSVCGVLCHPLTGERGGFQGYVVIVGLIVDGSSVGAPNALEPHLDYSFWIPAIWMLRVIIWCDLRVGSIKAVCVFTCNLYDPLWK